MVLEFGDVSVLTNARNPGIDFDGSLSNKSCELEKIICLRYKSLMVRGMLSGSIAHCASVDLIITFLIFRQI